MCAFANAGGGVLLIGIKDNGKPAKINASEEAYMVEAAAAKCRPSVEYSIEELSLDDRVVLHVQVLAGNERPYMALDEEGKWWAFIRVNDSNVLANWIWLQVVKLKSKHLNTKIAFGELEEALLKTIEEHPGLSQNQLAKRLKLSRNRLGKLLVSMVSMGVVEMKLSKDGAFFYSQSINKG